MSKYRKVAFVSDEEIPSNFIFSSVSDTKEYADLYSNSNKWFEFVDVSEISVNDFLYVLSSGLYQVTQIKG